MHSLRKNLIIGFFLANLAVIVGIWLFRSRSLIVGGSLSDELIAFGRLFGLLGEYFILVQLVLVGRIRAIEQVYGFDTLNRLHQKIGKWLGASLVLHPVFLIWGYARVSGISLWAQFLQFLAVWEYVWMAFIALLIILGAVLISLAIVRKKLRYETWYFSHLSMYLAIALVFAHQIQTADVSYGAGLYYWLALNFTVFGFVLLYRFIKPLWLFGKHRFVVEKVVKETDEVISIYITGRNMDTFRFRPGQYINLTFLAKRFWYTHPFSFSAAPNGKNIRITVKSLGDFTSTIHRVQPGTFVIIDGPLGIFTEEKSLRQKYLFIAGGIGITPIRALIDELAPQGKDMVLLYGNRDEHTIAFKEELTTKLVKITYIISSSTGHAPVGYETGYIDKEKIARIVPDYRDREVYLCGPDPMMRSVIADLKLLGIPEAQIHFEHFSH